jgi:hypothetical protein
MPDMVCDSWISMPARDKPTGAPIIARKHACVLRFASFFSGLRAWEGWALLCQVRSSNPKAHPRFRYDGSDVRSHRVAERRFGLGNREWTRMNAKGGKILSVSIGVHPRFLSQAKPETVPPFSGWRRARSPSFRSSRRRRYIKADRDAGRSRRPHRCTACPVPVALFS